MPMPASSPSPPPSKLRNCQKLWFYRQKKKVLLSSTAQTGGQVFILISSPIEFSQEERQLLLKGVEGVRGMSGDLLTRAMNAVCYKLLG